LMCTILNRASVSFSRFRDRDHDWLNIDAHLGIPDRINLWTNSSIVGACCRSEESNNDWPIDVD